MLKGKGKKRRKLKILVWFEPSRLGRAALEEAYERVAPARGKPPKGAIEFEAVPATISGLGE